MSGLNGQYMCKHALGVDVAIARVVTAPKGVKDVDVAGFHVHGALEPADSVIVVIEQDVIESDGC